MEKNLKKSNLYFRIESRFQNLEMRFHGLIVSINLSIRYHVIFN